MEQHISKNKLQSLLEKFIEENPNADTFEIAEHFFNLGWDCGTTETCDLF